MVDNGTGSVQFVDDVNADKDKKRVICAVHKTPSAKIKPIGTKVTIWHDKVQMEDEPRHIMKATSFRKTQAVHLTMQTDLQTRSR